MIATQIDRTTDSWKGNKAGKAPAKQNVAPKSQNALAQDMNKLAVSQQPTSRSKGLDVLAEYRKKSRKPAANFVVIGMAKINIS